MQSTVSQTVDSINPQGSVPQPIQPVTSTITLTFGECAENFAGMEKIGEKSDRGFTNEEILKIYHMFPGKAELYDLKEFLPPTMVSVESPMLLIVRNPFPEIATNLYSTLTSSECVNSENNIAGVAWDKHKFMYGKVVNSHARYNLCFADLHEHFKIFPDYEHKRGTVYNYKKIPALKWLHEFISSVLPGPFFVEGNNYYNAGDCYISMHRDRERRKTVGYRLGASFPLMFRWYHGTMQVSGVRVFMLNDGDFYVMSSLANGHDKDKNSGLYLKHAAGYNPLTYKK